MKLSDRRTIARQAPWNRKVKQQDFINRNKAQSNIAKTNSFGLVCPIPNSKWPLWALWLTVDKYEATYWAAEPLRDFDENHWVQGEKARESYAGDLKPQGDWTQNIWYRSEA